MHITVQKLLDRRYNLLSSLFEDKLADIDISALKTIADDLFRDNTCNWGRIISLFLFCGVVAKQATSRDMHTFIDDVALFIG